MMGRNKGLTRKGMSRREFLRASGAGIAGVALLGAAGCGDGSGGEQQGEGGGEQQSVTLSVGHVWPENDYLAETTTLFAEAVNEQTDSSVQLDISPAGQLGGDTDMVEGLGLGTVDMWIGGGGVLNAVSETGLMFFAPFIFASMAEGMDAYSGEFGEEMARRIREDSDIQSLGYWARSPRHLSMNSAAEDPSGVAGKRLRVPENPMALRTWETLGASPTPLPFPEVFSALEQGVVDGQENPLGLIHSSGFYQVQSHLMLTSHVVEPAVVTISASAWNRLSEEQQTALTEAATGEPKDFAFETAAQQEEDLRNSLQEEGMELIEPDRDAFREATAGVVEDNFPELTDLYNLVAD